MNKEEWYGKPRNDHLKVKNKLLELIEWAKKEDILPMTVFSVMQLFAIDIVKIQALDMLTKDDFFKTIEYLWNYEHGEK